MSFEQEYEAKLQQLMEDLKGESDRAAVIIAGAHLDTQVEDILRTALVPCASSEDTIFDGPNAPLHSFSNKIDFCYRLGLISNFMAKSLHLIRKIRNQFAHDIKSCNFADQSVKSRVNELYKLHRFDKKHTELQKIFDSSTKSHFLLSTTLILGVLNEVHSMLNSNEPKEAEWPFSRLL
jgi:DNA-binding MltR family transcriptional regulator